MIFRRKNGDPQLLRYQRQNSAQTLAEAWRMKRRWPWSQPEDFQGRLANLRDEFGIRAV